LEQLVGRLQSLSDASKAWKQFEGCLKSFGTAGVMLEKLFFGTAGGMLEKLRNRLKDG
jgi:hypothetical protein